MKSRRKSRRAQHKKTSCIFWSLLLLPFLPIVVRMAPSRHNNSKSIYRNLNASASMIGKVIPAHRNRLLHPWLVLPYVRPPSLIESGFRMLHSPLTEHCSAGLGHAFTVLNAELSTALLLHTSYSHRSTHFSSIPIDPDVFFNWGNGYLPRREIGNRYCHLQKDSKQCPVCKSISDEGSPLFHKIVVVPMEISYGCVSCRLNLKRVREFLNEHDHNNTLFQMHPGRCTQLPKSPDFTLSRSFFYSQYWRSNPFSSLSETNLNIVIHARRGDFFAHRNRRMTSLHDFAQVVKNALKVVNSLGDVFSQMPVKIILFSEGRSLKHSAAHDLSAMDNHFIDTDNQTKHAGHLYELLVGKEMHPEEIRTPLKSRNFSYGLSVEFRIATSIEETVRSMVAADIFVGSASDLSQYIVRVVSRAGLQLLPHYLGFMPGCCAVKFWKDGSILEKDVERMRKYWTSFVLSNRASASRAVGS
eukprot:gb/GEZJ01001407.1/.p1 GENE.gb/GEZJ01001407.1/~~gb/GEZJ01001407.1/.p1  ORF type:complete len:471 (+),score=47.90 gb/GEZJ01001407.1/:192-1604(+)